jgi:hypothetical protein
MDWGNNVAEFGRVASGGLKVGEHINFCSATLASLIVTDRNFRDLDLERQDFQEWPY